mmetsp:Transcript_17985/g.30614  ORF Transcript_17985/g.30614 Transcript_17985/m.30614 type:complete len:85 (+) Transcript_17985:659-913(+)
MAGASLMPEYFNAKIKFAAMLAPPMSLATNQNLVYGALTNELTMKSLEMVARKFNYLQWFPQGYYTNGFAHRFCELLEGLICEF